MSNPYRGRPAFTFWRQAVAECAIRDFDPVVRAAFTIERTDAIATAGSCFAQHIARTLVKEGYNYLVTEKFDGKFGTTDENYAVFPARFANLYTARQLLQLFDRAYGKFTPDNGVWQTENERYIDPFRPRIQANGFDTLDSLIEDRERHFAAVRQMFEACQVFIFTLGLTEAWVSTIDGSAYPLAPGIVTKSAAPNNCQFHNFTVVETATDLTAFLARLHAVNRGAKVLLTVSPVSLVATYEERHVVVSTIASKSILRAAVEEVCRGSPSVNYFPSYEIITGPQARGRFLAADMRDVTPEGVSYVMSLFKKHYLGGEERPVKPELRTEAKLSDEDRERMEEVAGVICDEEAIVT